MYVKDPADKLDYLIDWSALLGEGETIASVTWTVEVGLTQPVTPTASNTTTTATVWLEGGTAEETYDVACRITTNQARIVERSFTVQVEDR